MTQVKVLAVLLSAKRAAGVAKGLKLDRAVSEDSVVYGRGSGQSCMTYHSGRRCSGVDIIAQRKISFKGMSQ